ncbi:MAG: hypothetical protein HUJ74_03810 [Lachnospiraceae bacterium]|nr:hypothetical protein [Lachnospiraceae bacterium]
MIIASRIKETVSNAQEGVVLTTADFRVEPQFQQALVMLLCRMVKQGTLKKVSKGKYYKPKKSVFGDLPPASSESYKEFLQKGGKTVGYITGTQAFAKMGLTTQITSSVMIGTNKYRRAMMRGGVKITFILQPNPITEENIPLLRILDAIKLFKEIPAVSPDDCIKQITRLIEELTMEKKRKLAVLANEYTPFVRALVGAIFEKTNQTDLASGLRENLNGVTYFKLPISESALPNKKNWNII